MADYKETGETLRFFRKSLNLTLEYVSNGIMSPSNLSKIENGAIGVTFHSLKELLWKMNVPFEEFLIKRNIMRNTEYQDFVYEISHYYNMDNSTQLKKIYSRQYEFYEKSNNSTYFINGVTAEAFFCDLEEVSPPKNNQLKLEKILTTHKTWTYLDLSIFGNTMYILPQHFLMERALYLSEHVDYFSQSTQYYIDLLHTQFNVISTCIRRNEFHDAELILENIDQEIDISDMLGVEKCLQIFYKDVVFHILYKGDLSNANKALEYLDFIGSSLIHSKLSTILNKYIIPTSF